MKHVEQPQVEIVETMVLLIFGKLASTATAGNVS
jgi:hypothetical protein